MKSFLAAILVSAVLASGASAATFTDEALFDAEVASLMLVQQSENFDGELAKGASLGGPTPRSFDGFTTSLNSPLGLGYNVVRTGGLFNSDGLDGEHLYVGLLGGNTFTITFNSAVRAFGAMFAGVNNGMFGTLRSELLVDGAEAEWLGRTANTEEGRTARFFGFVSDTSFTEITFRGFPRTEAFGMDNLRWASAPPPTPVPVPASGVLLMGAMVVAGWFGRRRARA